MDFLIHTRRLISPINRHIFSYYLITLKVTNFNPWICFIAGYRGSGKIQDDNDGLLQRRDGLHPNVRHHKRGVVQFGAGLGHTDQNLFV